MSRQRRRGGVRCGANHKKRHRTEANCHETLRHRRLRFELLEARRLLATTYYVNDGVRTDDVFTSEVGSADFDGLTPATPKSSIQGVLASYELTDGDVILVDSGQYAGPLTVDANDIGFEVRGTEIQSSQLLDRVTLAGSQNVALRYLVLGDGLTLDGATGFTLSDSRVSSTSAPILVSNASAGDILTNDISGGNVGVDVSAGLRGTIQFNQIHNSVVGVEACDHLLVAHNVLYGNSTAGIQVQGKVDVRIINNTLHSEQGDNVRIVGGSAEVQLLSNILWAESGYDIFVANDSQSGFFSDYNTLHASGSGKIVWWTRDFTDILDWQADVHRFDLHSLGTTVINPNWSEPRFLDPDSGDYHVMGLVDGQRSSSPTIDAGSPLTDQALPEAYQNLLMNSGFELGLEAWNGNPEAGTDDEGVYAFEGQHYYSSGETDTAYAEQTVDLVAAGFSTAELDSRDLVAVFSARVRSAPAHLPDRSEVALSFWTGEDTELSTVTVQIAVTDDRWVLAGDRVHVPASTRFVKFRLLATSQSWNSQVTCFDQAQLFVLPDTVAPDQGAYGNSTLDHDLSSTPHLALRWPDLYTDWEREQPHSVRWDSYGNVNESLVRIDLVHDEGGGAQTITNLATGVLDTGQFTWIPADNAVDYGTRDLRIRVSLVDDDSVVDMSVEPFTVPEDGHNYYVNDGVDGTEEYSVAVQGSNRQTGKVPAAPKPNPANLLRTYELGPGDTLLIDTGVYPLFETLIFSARSNLGSGNDVAFDLQGPVAPASTAEFVTALPEDTGWPLMVLSDADYMTIRDITLTGGYRGMEVRDGSDHLSAENVTIRNAAAEGFFATSGWAGERVSIDSFVEFTVYGSGADGIHLSDAGAVSIEGCTVHDNGGYGIFVDNTVEGSPAVIGHSDLPLERGNRVYANADGGIGARGNVIVAGNTVYGHTGNYHSAGISLGNGVAEYNVVYENNTGLTTMDGDWRFDSPQFLYNRAFANTLSGIDLNHNGRAHGNVLYSNDVGIQLQRGSAQLTNNLIYSNRQQGVFLRDPWQVSIVNNTVYQPAGDAVHLAEYSGPVFSSSSVALRNNVLRVDSGYAVYVPPQFQAVFTSDFNDLWTTGSGHVGFWQGAARPTLAAWQNATFQDSNSIAQDPLWVDPAGADGVLGAEATRDGRDDDFHAQSVYGSYHGEALAPVEDPTTGLPSMPIGVVILDLLQSPLIDRGAAADEYANEPDPNGGFINLGVYGNTAQASHSPAEYVLVSRPDGGEFWPAGQTWAIRWRSHDFVGLVDISLVRPGFQQDIVLGAENNGQYSWNVPDLLEPHDDYRIVVQRAGSGGASDQSNEPFTIAAPTQEYFVSPTGDNANSGLTVDQPKASIRAVLEAYDMQPADGLSPRSIIYVAPGTYDLTANIVVGADDSGVHIKALDPLDLPVLNRGNTSTGSYVFELDGADGVTLENLRITGAEIGVYLAPAADSDEFELFDCDVFDIAHGGLDLHESNDDAAIVGNRFYRTGQSYGAAIEVRGGRATVSGNHVVDNQTGIVGRWEGTAADQIEIVGNRVHDNRGTGIEAWFQVQVTGNTVYGHMLSGDQSGGISLYGATATENMLYGNSTGIAVGNVVCRYSHCDYYDGIARDNVLYDNQVGIAARLASVIEGNRAYSNSVGVHVQGIQRWTTWHAFTGELAGNVIYGNTEQGILIEHAAAGAQVDNNTVYQPQGAGIQVQEASSGVTFSSNIIAVASGPALAVSVDSVADVASDYNVIHVTGSGTLGLFAGREFVDAAEWYYETGLDEHSRTADPKLVDPDGGNDVLGFSRQFVGNSVIIDDGDAGFETVGTWQGYSGPGYGGDYVEAHPGDGNIARWTFTDLIPGQTYQLSVTWPDDSGLDYDAEYGVYENGLRIAAPGGVPQYEPPAGFHDAGHWWRPLLVFRAVTDSYSLELSPDAYWPVRADAAHLVQIVGNAGDDDDLHVLSTSPAIDAGNPASAYLREPQPNGNRVNAGAFGNTPQAAASPSRVLHVVSPNGLEKLEVGHAVSIRWQSAGLSERRPVALINAGGPAVGYWSANTYQTSGGVLAWDQPSVVDTGHILNPPPADVYATSAWDWRMDLYPVYELPVPAGLYTVRLHFVETYDIEPGQRVFDILLNGETVRDDYDILSDAGAHHIATAQTFEVLVSGDEGIRLELESVVDAPILAAIEVSAEESEGTPAPTVDVDWYDGQSWRSIASDVAMGHYGQGSIVWVPDTTAADALVRVTEHGDVTVRDVSDRSFMVTTDGSEYYVSPPDRDGDNRNSGKSLQEPMASLAALLRVYDLDAGDTVHVASGSYSLLQNLSLDRSDSGVLIQGPAEPDAPAVLDRAYQAPGSCVLELADITDVVIDRLHVTGAFTGITIVPGDEAGERTIRSSDIYGNAHAGVNATNGLTNGVLGQVLIQDNHIYDNGGIDLNDQGGGMFLSGTNILARGNDVYGNVHVGITARYGPVVDGNTVYGHRREFDSGILLREALASGNVVYGNYVGISVGEYQWSGGEAIGNTLYANEVAGLDMYSGEARDNVIYSGQTGILARDYVVLANNLVYDTTVDAIVLERARGRLINNTVVPAHGNAIRGYGESTGIQVTNNLLYAGSEGYAISVASDSQYEFVSDYNFIQLPGTGKLGLWGDVEFVSLVDWQYELGLDRQSRIEDPEFVDVDGADGVLGFRYEPVGAAQVIDDGDPGFLATGDWTELAGDAYSGDFLTSSQAGSQAWAEWTFPGLIAGQPYQLSVTWPDYGYRLPWYARFEIYDGDTLLSVARVDQNGPSPDDFEDVGISWERLGVYETSGDTLSVVLRRDVDDSGEYVVADALHLVPVEGHHGADDDFHVGSGSPAIDAGDPNSYFFRELMPNGGRANLGAYGNSAQATASPEQVLQIVSPNGGEKLELGNVDVQWRLAGYGAEQLAALINLGGGSVDNWLADEFRVGSGRDFAVTDAIDLSGVTNPAPEAVYATFVQNFGTHGTAGNLVFAIPLPDGEYTVRLHFMEHDFGASQRRFDIGVQGSIVVEDYDIYTAAGGSDRAVVASFPVEVDGEGLLIELLGKSLNGSALSAIEIVIPSPSAPTMPQVDLESSADGGSNWQSIATDQTADRFGRGRSQWDVSTESDQGLVRVLLAGSATVGDESDEPFMVADAGPYYYVNVPGPAGTAGNEYTTAPGNNANSGKSAAAPMAGLGALLNAYDLEPGDVVFVDTGTYRLPVNILLRPDDSGVRIQGPTGLGSPAVLDRDNSAVGSYGFEFLGADEVTLRNLDISGGDTGIYIANDADSDHVTVFACTLADNVSHGIAVSPTTRTDTTNSHALLEANIVRDSDTGIVARGADIVIRNNEVFGNGTGIEVAGLYGYGYPSDDATTTLIGNVVHDNSKGISLNPYTEARANTVFGNVYGVYVNDARVLENVIFQNEYGVYGGGNIVGNRVYDNQGIGMAVVDGVVQGNRVYSNSIGIRAERYAYYFYGYVIDFQGELLNNVVYLNANEGIVVSRPADSALVANNTVYQLVGDALRVENEGISLAVRNNILWSDSGYAISVSADSQAAVDSDYNLFHQGTDPDAHLGLWDATTVDTLAEWQVIAGQQDMHSLEGDPLFVDMDGADNVFGFEAAGIGTDGGSDDNLMLAAHSPAIDAASSWHAAAGDFFGAPRADDPATPNSGTDDYFEQSGTPIVFGSAASAVIVMANTDLATDEDGATAEFTVVLAGRPSADVMIALSSSDPSEGTVQPAGLVFTSDNWKLPQIVTVAGVDDGDVDGNVKYTVVTSAATSADASYDGLDVADVSVVNVDHEPPIRGQVVVDGGVGVSTHEDGWTASFYVRLDRAPIADVTFTVTSSDIGEGVASPAVLTFTPDNWTSAQAVDVTGVDDGIEDGPSVYRVVLGACDSDDPLFAGVDPRDVAVVNADNDQGGITKLTSNAIDDWYPLADGGLVGWGRENPENPGAFDIVLYDGGGSQTVGQAIYPPRIDNGRFAWTGGSWSAPEVYLYDGLETRLLGSGENPQIDGDYVAWIGGIDDDQVTVFDGTGSQVVGAGYGVQLDAGQVAWIGLSASYRPAVFFFDGTRTVQLADTEAAAPEDLPQIDSGQVVWSGMNGFVREIYFFDGDLDGGPHVQVIGSGYRPQLDSGRVAWVDTFTGHLMLFDGSTTVDLSQAPINEFDLDRAYVAWSTGAAAADEVYLYDGNTTYSLGPGRNPQVDAGQVVWVSEYDGWPLVSSTVSFYDGLTTRLLGRGESPWLEAGTVVWQHRTGASNGIYFFDGTDVRQLSPNGSVIIDWPESAPGQTFGNTNDFVMDSGSVVWTTWDGNDSEVYRYTPGENARQPTAFGDGLYHADYGTPLSVTAGDGLLANDVAPGGAGLVAQLAGEPAHGTVLLQSDGAFQYTPEPGFWGTDEFTYVAFDGTFHSYPVAVSLEIGEPGRILISNADGLYTSESGFADSFQVLLSSQPTQDVTVSLQSNDTTEGTVVPGTLTFTRDNWNQAQNVTVTGVNDDVADGGVDYLIITEPATSEDPRYQAYDAPDVSVRNYDNDWDPTIKNWHADDGSWWVSLPFSFPFYGTTIDSLWVTSNGLLHFGSPESSSAADNNEAELIAWPRIAPLWDDLSTLGVRDDIYVEEFGDHFVVRWNATNKANDGDAQFAAILYSDGRIQFEYGPGNEGLTPTVGISWGRHGHYRLSAHDGATGLEYADARQFHLAPGYADLGAFEFLGDSDDIQPPRLVGTVPAGIDSGTVAGGFFAATIQFSEPINVIDARAPADYDLRTPGVNETFGDGDDVVIQVIPSYVIGAHSVSLSVSGGMLPAGRYQLTVSGTSSIHDQAGIRLDGDNDGQPGGDYVRQFEVLVPGITINPTSGLVTSEDGLSAQFTVKLESPPVADVTIELVSSEDDEGTVSPDRLVFTADNWNVPQTVTVTGVDDSVYDGDVMYWIVTSPATSDDAVYSDWDPDDVAVVNRENDPVPQPKFWQNPRNHLDVNDDGRVIPLDALLIINELSRKGAHDLPVPPMPPVAPPPFYDVSGNDRVEPRDVLMIINYLSRIPNGESESAGAGANALTGDDRVTLDSGFLAGVPIAFHPGAVFVAEMPSTVAVEPTAGERDRQVDAGESWRCDHAWWWGCRPEDVHGRWQIRASDAHPQATVDELLNEVLSERTWRIDDTLALLALEQVKKRRWPVE